MMTEFVGEFPLYLQYIKCVFVTGDVLCLCSAEDCESEMFVSVMVD